MIVRDLLGRDFRTYKQFLKSSEGIATNSLADRLNKLESTGINTAEKVETDGRKVHYRLTEKGIDLAPVVLDLLIWAARHEPSTAPCARIDHLAQNRENVLTETRRRWRQRDLTPLIPKFIKENQK